jgi:G6PDH family F420-dependent oxidoreductase
VQGGFKVCYGRDEQAAVETAHRLWANEQLPGELAQVLPTPAHFEQASQLVTPDMVGQAVVCGPDADRHAENVRQFVQAGYDEVYIQQIGPDQEEFFRFWSEDILPKLR